ncbi:MAG TPA: hypothetical protein DD671_13685 [Balneolaceae bacterium]|nr:hypothetical protein [Balneolaceae bacterium]
MSLPLNELKAFESEIKNNFNELTDARKLLQDISDKVIQEAQTAITAANDTASYDEKIDSLVKGIQGIVKTVQDTKRSVDSASEKHKSDLQLLSRLKTRFSDTEEMEKKTSTTQK